MRLLDRCRAWEAQTRLKIVRWINRSAMALTAAAISAHKEYPQLLEQAATHIPWWLAAPVAVGFFVVIEHAAAKPKDPA